MPVSAPPDPFLRMAEHFSPTARDNLATYYWDPVGFAENCIEWPEGKSLTEYQREALAEVARSRRVCVRSMRGAGKSAFLAIIILWFCVTRDAAGHNWKCPITAGSWRQLKKFLFPEIHLWARRLRWDIIGRQPFKKNELMTETLRLNHGEAFALASDDPNLIEGAHADCVMFVFDESKSIAAATFDAAEGVFSAEGAEDIEAFAIAASTPGEPEGRFWQIQTQALGTEDWAALHWTLERVMATGRVTKKWVEQRAKLWGRKSALFANQVLGEFHSADEDSVIPLAWIEKAIKRWEDRHVPDGNEDPMGLIEALGPLDKVSVDVARFGHDESVIGLIHGRRMQEMRAFFHADTMETTGRVVGVLNAHPGAYAVIDTDGLGAGVTDRSRELGADVVAFHAGEGTDEVDASGELGFVNVRSAAWWKLREALDPANHPDIELPPDDKMKGDLCAPKWKVLSNGRIQVEKKDEIKKRIGRSTDHGDCVVMGFYEERQKRRARMGSMGADDEDYDEGYAA